MSKKKKARESAPVETGHDYRAKQNKKDKPDTTAPDGISGDWS